MDSETMDHQKSAFVGPVLYFLFNTPKSHLDGKIPMATSSAMLDRKKSEIHRVRLTAGGDKLDAYEETSSPTVSLIDAKLHFNSTISDAHDGARHLGLDIKNFYLGTPMDHRKFQRYPYVSQKISILTGPNQ